MYAVYHEIDTHAHPTLLPGWRWAVHLGGSPSDVSTCVNAGWERDEMGAFLTADAHLATSIKVARACGAQVFYEQPRRLDRDPIAAGCETVNVI